MNTHIEELFLELADLSVEERTQYFSDHDIDDDTRQEVEALLGFDSGATEFLMRDIRLAADRSLAQLETPDAGAHSIRCGPYRLLEVIGRGGMGTVFLAERADGEVSQRVAVKLLPAGSGDRLRERFLQERQILAALAHPNIARMLDAGSAGNGQPFLAMEYVEGKAIDVFAAGLNLREKISLFLKVCAAVAYLHRNLVVHRDLKPSNILVTADGEPKLLDFGIAKIMDIATDATATGLRMLTPDYASPEQVIGDSVTTATDIYSLGAVLYRMLTGIRAHEFEDASPGAIIQAVTTREITRPSKWAPELKGDLEAILLKALRKDPRERYATVEQLAEDLEAFIDSRPVKARSGNSWYRTRKFVRRCWIPVTAAALVMVSLSMGLYVANRQRRIAEAHFAQVHDLSKKLLDVEAELRIGDLKLRNQLVSLSIQYVERLAREALHDKALALETASAYLRVARIQGVVVFNQMGQYAEAGKSLDKAEMFVNSVLATDPSNRRALWLSANIAHDRAHVAYAQNRVDQVLAPIPTIVARFDQLAQMGNLTRREINGATSMYGDIAALLVTLHRFEDAARFSRLAIEFSKNTKLVPGPRTQAFNMLAMSSLYLGDPRGALDAVQKARAQWERIRYDDPTPDAAYAAYILAQTRWTEGIILGDDTGVNLNRPAEAAVVFQQAVDALEPITQKDPNDSKARSDLALSALNAGDILRHSDAGRALKIYDHGLTRIREVADDTCAKRLEALLLASSSYALRSVGRTREGRARIDAAIELLRETKDYPADATKPDSEAAGAMRALADHYAETGNTAQALETYQDLRRRMLASKPDPENDLVNAAQISRLDVSFAALLRRARRQDEAQALDEERIEMWQRWRTKLPDNPFVLRQNGVPAVPKFDPKTSPSI